MKSGEMHFALCYWHDFSSIKEKKQLFLADIGKKQLLLQKMLVDYADKYGFRFSKRI